jgi:hypothetical protein
MKIISFLGLRSYQETTYLNPLKSGSGFSTPFCQEALIEFYQPDTLYVFLTETVEKQPPAGASESNWTALKKRVSEKVNLQPVKNIPESNTPEDIWAIFQRVNECLVEGDRVLFDITYIAVFSLMKDMGCRGTAPCVGVPPPHPAPYPSENCYSFRSVPIVALISVSYLRTVRGIQIAGLIYGALEARNKETNETPIFDLLPIVSLLDWTNAVDQFTQTGDARRLAQLLNPNGDAKGSLKKASETLLDVSMATFLCQPLQLNSKLPDLEQTLLNAQEQLQQTAQPFEVLRQRVIETFQSFSGDFTQDTKAALQSQLHLINWYRQNNQLIQAMSLAREWLINAVTYRLGKPFTLSLKDRENLVAKAISGVEMVKCGRLDALELNEYGRQIYENWEDSDELSELWNSLQPVRNTLDHAGHQETAMAVKKIVKRVDDKIMPMLNKISEEWHLNNEL